MAIISNINDLFSVDSTGAIEFNEQVGTSGYSLESRGAGAPPVWTDRDTGKVTGSGTLNKVARWTADGSDIGDGPITFATNDSTFAGTGSFANNLDATKSQNTATSITVSNINAGSSQQARFVAIADSGNIQIKAISTANTTYGVGDVGVINCDTMSNGLKFAHNDQVKYTLAFNGENTWTGGGTFGGNVNIDNASSISKLTIEAGIPSSVSGTASIDLISRGSGSGTSPISRIEGIFEDSNDSAITLSTTLGGVLAEKMRITSGARINMDVMATAASEGVIRIGRYDANTSRYNEIQNSVTSTGAGSYMNLSVHSGTENVLTDVMTLLGSGNVGIGTDSPEAGLHISRPASLTDGLILERTGGSPGKFRLSTNSDSLYIKNIDGISTNPFMIQSDGDIGMGTNSPSSQLEIFTPGNNTTTRLKVKGDNGSTQISIESTIASGVLLEFKNLGFINTMYMTDVGDFAMDIESNTTGSYENAFTILANGYFGIHEQSPSYYLDVDGDIRATGDIIAYSDERVKENIKTIDNSLEKVTKLRGVEFNKIGDDVKSIGVIAQEIEKILPEVVKEDDKGMKSVAYGNMSGLLIEAIKELKDEIEELKLSKCNCNCK